MIRRHAKLALPCAAVLLAACQGMMPGRSTGPVAANPPPPAATAMDGQWASTDGIFVASFGGGAFTSRFTKTNEILAQGTYSVVGNQVSMQWLSVAAQQQRQASCTMTGPRTVQCQQAGGGGFELRRA